MAKLNTDWLTEGMLDFEYKKYLLQAYFQSVLGQFQEHRLYPYLPEVRAHYSDILKFRESKRTYRSSFPKNLVGIDQENFKLQYQESINDTPYLSEVDSIINFAAPRFSKVLVEGEERLKLMEHRLQFSSVGIVPLRNEEGYLFIHKGRKHETVIYRYQLALFNSSRERQVQTEWVDRVKKGVGTTFENMKIELTRKYRTLPNPATYIVESDYDYPIEEALLPVAKRLIVSYINVA